MVKFPEANARLFQGVFVCKKCKTRKRANIQKIILGKVTCRRCGCHSFRPLKKK